ncbi:MAG: ABC transporter permease [Acidobacteriota bacterium]|nr:ABC transporter permease [Acidobacteriota bacterium]
MAGVQISPAFIRSLRVPLRMGSWFDASPADLHSAVISESLWRRIGSDPAIIGKSLIINAVPYTVVGVAPAWFLFPFDWGKIVIWVPLDPTGDERASRGSLYMNAFAKKKPGVTDAQVAADLTRIAFELEREHPDSEKNHTVAIESLLSKAVEYVRPSLLLLLAGAAALLLIACGNVTSLLLARSVARVRETAMRVALGATAGNLHCSMSRKAFWSHWQVP